MCNMCEECILEFTDCVSQDERNRFWEDDESLLDFRFVLSDSQVVQCDRFLPRTNIGKLMIYTGTEYGIPRPVYIIRGNSKMGGYNVLDLTNQSVINVDIKRLIEFNIKELRRLTYEWKRKEAIKNLAFYNKELDINIHAYKIDCEWDMGFAEVYSSYENARKDVEEADWSLCCTTLEEAEADGLVNIIEVVVD